MAFSGVETLIIYILEKMKLRPERLNSLAIRQLAKGGCSLTLNHHAMRHDAGWRSSFQPVPGSCKYDILCVESTLVVDAGSYTSPRGPVMGLAPQSPVK